MVLAILESGTAYCTMHTAESGVRLGLAETESTRGRGLRFPFAKQEEHAVHLVLQTIGCRGQRAEGSGQRGIESSAAQRDRPVPFQVPHPSHERGTCKCMHAVSWNGEDSGDTWQYDHRDRRLLIARTQPQLGNK